MPSAVVTVRELKNKDTGIDLTVPTHAETAGLLTTTVEYHVLVVSRLHAFKSPKHKESDNVQFMIPHKLDKFQELHSMLSEHFPGTVLPVMPRKSLMINETVIRHRKKQLDEFVQFIAKTPKLCTCPVVMEFLGVSPIKAGKYRKEADNRRAMLGVKSENAQGDLLESNMNVAVNDQVEDSISVERDLFGEVEEEDVELFGISNKSDQLETDTITEEEEMYLKIDKKKRAGRSDANRLFADQDFGGGIDEDSDLLKLAPGARMKPNTTGPVSVPGATEDHSDLLSIEDDLDKFLTMDVRSAKPVTPKKPKKPSLSTKPKLKPKPTDSITPLDVNKTTDMGTDDIMKYIDANTGEKDNVELFS